MSTNPEQLIPILKFNSELQEDIVLVEVLSADKFLLVKVLGEEELRFDNSANALAYAAIKHEEFYSKPSPSNAKPTAYLM